jgi:hypothetical protein
MVGTNLASAYTTPEGTTVLITTDNRQLELTPQGAQEVLQHLLNSTQRLEWRQGRGWTATLREEGS